MAVTGSQDTTVRLIRIIKAASGRVFSAWTPPASMKLWAAPGDMTVPYATAEVRVGGRYEIHMRAPSGVEHHVAGTYREIDPPNRLVYTWQWQNVEGAPETIVTVEFRPHVTGTELVLVHDLPDADARGRHEHGWLGCLDRLGQLFS